MEQPAIPVKNPKNQISNPKSPRTVRHGQSKPRSKPSKAYGDSGAITHAANSSFSLDVASTRYVAGRISPRPGRTWACRGRETLELVVRLCVCTWPRLKVDLKYVFTPWLFAFAGRSSRSARLGRVVSAAGTRPDTRGVIWKVDNESRAVDPTRRAPRAARSRSAASVSILLNYTRLMSLAARFLSPGGSRPGWFPLARIPGGMAETRAFPARPRQIGRAHV